jgi:hypothetical protein
MNRIMLICCGLFLALAAEDDSDEEHVAVGTHRMYPERNRSTVGSAA